MKFRNSLPGVGLSSSILLLVCASAFGAVQQPPRARTIDPPLEPATVVVADPRYPSIRIELPARDVQAARKNMATLYRKLVRGARPSAGTVVAENGRIYFRRSESLMLRLAESIEPHNLLLARQATTIAR